MEYTELIQDLKRKKELKDLDDNFIKERINEYLKDKKLPDNKRSKEYREIFKDLRKQLRKVYGVFRQVEEGRNPEFYKLIFDKINPKAKIDVSSWACKTSTLFFLSSFRSTLCNL